MSADQRTLVGAPVTVRWQPTDGDGLPADPGGTVTVSVARADGTAVTAGAVAGGDSEERTATITAANNLLLDVLTVSWKVDAVTYATTTVEVVGGILFTVDEMVGVERSIGGSEHKNEDIVAVRKEVEERFEEWCGGAFFPSFAVERRPATRGSVFLSKPNVRTIRSIRRYDSTTDASVYTDATAAELAVIQTGMPAPAAVFAAPSSVWSGPLRVGYEHGLSAVPRDVKRAGMRYARYLLNTPKSTMDERATSINDPATGITAQLITPGVRGAWTAIPEVNAVIDHWADQFYLPLVG